MQTPPEEPILSNYPRPEYGGDREVLRAVAASQRQVMQCVLGQIGVGLLNGIAAVGKIPVLATIDAGLLGALLIFMIVSVVRLAKALGLSQVLYAVLMFIPCVSLFVLLSISGKATKQLSQAGIKVGLLGADPNSV
jgi:hypothetical protein